MMKFLKILLSEIRMNVFEFMNYKFAFIIDIVVYTILYAFFILTGSGYKLTQQYAINDSRELVLSAYIIWIISLAPIEAICNEIRMENIKGTFEQKLMSVFPIWWILLCKVLSSIIINIVEIVVILVIAAFAFKVFIFYNLFQIITIFINIIGMSGMALIMGAIVINKKNIGQLLFVVQIGLLFLSNTIIRVTGGIFEKIIPLSYANHIVRLINMGSGNIGIEIIVFFMVSIIWLAVGIILFNKAIENCKRKGTISLF
ncbi:ABC transporter permease [Caproiciproducens sp. LBM24188]